MAATMRHALSQAPVVGSLLRTAFEGAIRAPSAIAHALPGPWIEAEVAPRDPSLVREYIRFTGGDAAWYRGTIPPHMFSQWSFAYVARALRSLPYSLFRVMNAGCRIEPRAPLPIGQPLVVRARVESIDDDGRRAILTQRIVTGTKREPNALVATIHAYVPLASKAKDGAKNGQKRRAAVPLDVHELAFVRFGKDAGREFAKLTGDVNPIHWVEPWARASGFKTCILHGFATYARAIESLNRARFAGDPTRLAAFDARFTRPLPLPARVGVYVDDARSIWVGDAPGGGAYLEGSYETEARS
jgi:hypothetical protein